MEECNEISVRPQGIPTEFGVMLIILLVLACAGNVYQSMHAPSSNAPSDAIQKAQLEANTAQIKMTTDQQKGIFAIQMEVIKSCTAKGGSPAFVGGNISCQK